MAKADHPLAPLGGGGRNLVKRTRNQVIRHTRCPWIYVKNLVEKKT
jgi:hypothetical protein